ncbi:hypothetical protein AOQ71_34325 [Bradyrhizobium manausense]|uniref:Uncharacterized protein n=1 Tax=Bradyrhizobium manausense TaxID=989370 RepID=A0A0R3D613_9BRAD|nr:hypothetical protein AOQ71_34325 [Bradyrhizobium manausense]
MKQHMRAAVAAVAFAHALRREVLSLYEHETRGYNRIRVWVNANWASGYDSDNQCKVGGSLPYMFHQGVRSRWRLRPRPLGAYSGFDHDTSSFFSVKVTSKHARLFDHREGADFTYTIWSGSRTPITE